MSKRPDVAGLALALPEAAEAPHHGFPSFRVRGKIFATWPDEEHLHVLLDADDARRAVAADPGCCEELWWGKTLAGVRVLLDRAETSAVDQLLRAAWLRRAPASLRPLLEDD